MLWKSPTEDVIDFSLSLPLSFGITHHGQKERSEHGPRCVSRAWYSMSSYAWTSVAIGKITEINSGSEVLQQTNVSYPMRFLCLKLLEPVRNQTC